MGRRQEGEPRRGCSSEQPPDVVVIHSNPLLRNGAIAFRSRPNFGQPHTFLVGCSRYRLCSERQRRAERPRMSPRVMPAALAMRPGYRAHGGRESDGGNT